VRTINGVPIYRSRLLRVATLWRWKITDVAGREYLDENGPFERAEDAEQDMLAAIQVTSAKAG